MRFNNKKITLTPTDLANFLSCRHLTGLDLNAAQSGEKRPARFGPMIDALRERGLAHEHAYLERLKADGLIVSEPGGDWTLRKATFTGAASEINDWKHGQIKLEAGDLSGGLVVIDLANDSAPQVVGKLVGVLGTGANGNGAAF